MSVDRIRQLQSASKKQNRSCIESRQKTLIGGTTAKIRYEDPVNVQSEVQNVQETPILEQVHVPDLEILRKRIVTCQGGSGLDE